MIRVNGRRCARVRGRVIAGYRWQIDGLAWGGFISDNLLPPSSFDHSTLRKLQPVLCEKAFKAALRVAPPQSVISVYQETENRRIRVDIKEFGLGVVSFCCSRNVPWSHEHMTHRGELSSSEDDISARCGWNEEWLMSKTSASVSHYWGGKAYFCAYLI